MLFRTAAYIRGVLLILVSFSASFLALNWSQHTDKKNTQLKAVLVQLVFGTDVECGEEKKKKRKPSRSLAT